MLGIVFLGDRRVELREFPDPTPGPGEAVLEIKASGMCGTDLRAYRKGKPGGVYSIAATSPAVWLSPLAQAYLRGRPKSARASWCITMTAAESASIAVRAGRKSAMTARFHTDQGRRTVGTLAT